MIGTGLLLESRIHEDRRTMSHVYKCGNGKKSAITRMPIPTLMFRLHFLAKIDTTMYESPLNILSCSFSQNRSDIACFLVNRCARASQMRHRPTICRPFHESWTRMASFRITRGKVIEGKTSKYRAWKSCDCKCLYYCLLETVACLYLHYQEAVVSYCTYTAFKLHESSQKTTRVVPNQHLECLSYHPIFVVT